MNTQKPKPHFSTKATVKKKEALIFSFSFSFSSITSATKQTVHSKKQKKTS
jgi:hypothetical protein